jgi:anti-anti-sigma regulatory factor
VTCVDTVHQAPVRPRRLPPSGPPPGSPLRVTVVQPVPETLRLELAGELDMAAEPLLRELSDALVLSGPEAVELDVGGLAFVDLRGLRSLGALLTALPRRAAVTLTRTSRAFDRLVAVCAQTGTPMGWLPA